MLKIIAVSLMLAGTAQAKAPDKFRACFAYAGLAQQIAVARDAGLSKIDVIVWLKSGGVWQFDPEKYMGMIDVIYKSTEIPPADVRAVVFAGCMAK